MLNIINNAKISIANYNNQIANYTASINNLGIPALENQQTIILANLNKAYDDYNARNIDITPYTLNISINIQSINTLSGQLTTINNQIKADNQSLSDTNALIINLQNQLNAALQNKNNLELRILQSVTNSSNTQK
jgi:hypothetical protein